jgi:hypothetical protein
VDDLVQWLGEQLDEDERIARAAGEAERADAWSILPNSYGGVLDGTGSRSIAVGYGDVMAPATATHIAAHDPARVLREIDAKRDLLRFAEGIHDYHETFTRGVAARLGETLRLYALAYADRPGYREEWRP